MENHCGQTLEQLARRHGLSWYELLCVLLDKPFTEVKYDKEKNYKELCQMALVSEEVKQYRAIGTLEECRAAIALRDYPTAYDPDKVVEQLEAYSNADEAERLGTMPVVELADAIKIVKGGGVE